MSKEDNKKVATGALMAGLIGFTVGLLTAPKSGRETRKDIAEKAVKAKTEAEKSLKEVHSQLHAMLINARKDADSLTGKARMELDRLIDSASDAKEKVREIISAIHEGDADDPDLKQALKDARDALKDLEKHVKRKK